MNLRNSSAGQHIQVSVRLRPMNSKEKKEQSNSLISVGNKEVILKDYPLENLTKKYIFDKVFGPESKQVDVYRAIAKPLIDEVLSGYNCTVFAYGQTGTGKTYTMEGGEMQDYNLGWERDNSSGIVPRTLSHLIDTLRLQQVEYTLRVSYIELYNEELFDLLSPNDDNSKIRIYEDTHKKGAIILHGVEEVTINNKKEVFKILEKGSAKRQKACTLLNAESSRSHTVFTITVHIKENSMDGEELLKIGKLNLVDLAGSENISRSGAQDKRAREAGNINQSLLTLGRVITALVERAPHIPYRESKLTRLLQESLGGRTKTSIIATISPSCQHLEETLSTLEYAYRAKNITNKPEINQKLTKRTLIKEYTSEIDRLRQDLAATRDKNGVYLAHENYQKMQEQLAEQEKEICSKIEQISFINERHEKNLILFSELNMKIESYQAELEHTESQLKTKQNELHQTRIALEKAHQSFQEQIYLVSKVDETEKKLTEQANALLTVANESTNDISKLHDKLERKKALESLNKMITNQFYEKFTKKTTELQSCVVNFLEEKEEVLKVQEEKINCTLSKIKTLFAQHTESTMHIKNNLEIFTKNNTSQISNQTDSITNLKEQVSNNSNQNITMLDHYHRDISSIYNEIHQNHISRQLEMNTLFAQFTRKTASEIFQFCNAFFIELNKKFNDLNENFKKEMKEKIELLEKIKDETLEEKNEVEQMTEQLETHILDFFKKHKEQNVKKQVSIANQTFLKDQMQKFRNVFSNNILENDAHITNFNMHLTSKYQNQIDEISQHLEEETNSLQKYEEKLKEYQGKEEERIKTLTLKQNENSKLLIKDLDSLCDRLDDQLQDAEDFSKFVFTNINNMNQDCSEENLVSRMQFEEIKENNYRFVNEIGQTKMLFSNQIQDLNSQIEEFVSKELLQDQPTGETPQRKEFSYPMELAATSPHDRIIQRFRELNLSNDLDVKENEADNETLSASNSNDDEEQLSFDKSKSSSLNSLSSIKSEKENGSSNTKPETTTNKTKRPKPHFKKPLTNITNKT